MVPRKLSLIEGGILMIACINAEKNTSYLGFEIYKGLRAIPALLHQLLVAKKVILGS